MREGSALLAATDTGQQCHNASTPRLRSLRRGRIPPRDLTGAWCGAEAGDPPGGTAGWRVPAHRAAVGQRGPFATAVGRQGLDVTMAGSTRHAVGWSGKRLRIAPSWRVLDVGSGHSPFERADVLLERFVEDDAERSGAPIDRADPRLVEGDALAMPFPDKAFDYVVASHIAEHVDDPEQLGRELSRVARAGYVETPGWFGDMLLREPFHPWRVRRRGDELHFVRVSGLHRPGSVGEWAYAICYLGVERPGHRSITTNGRLLGAVYTAIRYAIAGVFRLPGIVDLMYLRHEWEGELRCPVIDASSW